MSTDKLTELINVIARYKRVIIAFSGGVDSTLLARAAKEVLGKDNVLLITATSSTYPFYELEESKQLAELLDLRQRIINSEETKIPGFSNNPPDRCYYCKGELFGVIRQIADSENYAAVFDGSNADDLKDYRPGRKALKEHDIKSPLVEAGLTKKDIRKYSRIFNLPTADKPAYACLASRFPYGENITTEKLNRVGDAELKLRNMGFKQFRIRSHDNLARIEIDNEEMEKGWEQKEHIVDACKKSGFAYVTIDLEGYRTGSMNEVLNSKV